MRNFVSSALIVSALICFASPASAAIIDNPDYKSWAAQKPGAKLTYESVTNMQGMSINTEITQVLKSIAPDKVVIEVTTVIKMGEFKQEQKASKDVLAKVEETQQFLPPEMKGTAKKSGTGTVKAANQDFQCEIFDFSGEGPTGTATGKIWRSEKVPGGVVQMEIAMQMPQGAATSKMLLKEITPGT